MSARDRQWLIEAINKDWMTFAGQSEDTASTDILQKILALVRDPDSFRQETLPGKLSLVATCPYSAAQSALTLTHLEQLPLPCLHVMLEVLLEKPPDVMFGKLPVGGNKERVVTALLEKSGDLLSYDQPGEALPEALRKSLVVMSNSARYAFGDDGNLLDFLGPLPLETQLLQGNLLSALTYLKKLNYENLQLVHRELIGAPQKYEKRHRGNLRYPIRRILLDCLLRSEVRSVPEEVKAVALTIKTLAVKQVDGPHEEASEEPPKKPVSDSRFNEPLGDDARSELEVEATLRISRHLLQIMYNWKEVLSERCPQEECQRMLLGFNVPNRSGCHVSGPSDVSDATPRTSLGNGIHSGTDVTEVGEDSLAEHLRYGGSKVAKPPFERDSFVEVAEAAQTEGGNITASNSPDVSEGVEIDGTAAEAMENLHLTKIADEAAEVGYALVGCAMERTARSSGVSLKRPVRKYLRSGTIKKIRTGPGEGMNVEQHQLAMILKIAGKIPSISPRVMDNVKKRLGMG